MTGLPLAILLIWATAAHAAHPRNPLPIGLADESPRKSNKAAECHFGKQVKELGDTWFADLGPPFGVMYCIRCECLPIQKKRRIMSKVQCRNIQNECPKVSCAEPVLRPKSCCKVCPDNVQDPDVFQDAVQATSLEEDEPDKHFVSVLTGGGPSSGSEASEIATGRFTFQDRNLYYSFYVTLRPRAIQFLDNKGNILEEKELGRANVYEDTSGKVCGVWRRIPREYRRLIKEEKMSVSLTWGRSEETINGHIKRYRNLPSEMFSALLEGTPVGSGGTAIIRMSTAPPSIHLALLFDGIFTSADVVITLHTLDGQHVPINEVVHLEKGSSQINAVEVSSVVSEGDLLRLSEQRLFVTVRSKTSNFKLSGRAVTKATCEMFQSLLLHSNHYQFEDEQPPGFSWLYVNKRGALNYHIRVENVVHPILIGLVLERGKVTLEDLSSSLENGWANGTVNQLSPRQVEELYSGGLAINIATKGDVPVMKGRLISKLVTDSDHPFLLRKTPEAKSPAAGLGWMSMDIDCNFQYEVQLVGVESKDLELHVTSVPLVLPEAPVTSHFRERFASSAVEGSVLSLLPSELLKIDSGFLSLEILDLGSNSLILKGDWQKVSVPSSCLPQYTDNELKYSNDVAQGEEEQARVCFHGGRFHKEGAQWRSQSEHCTVCHCAAGKTSCEPLICPPLPPGCIAIPSTDTNCCPGCQNVSMVMDSAPIVKGCTMAEQFFLPGSSWHPYLPPNGFDTCTLCTCEAKTLKVSCSRVVCPPLKCDERLAVKSRKKKCCKVCPEDVEPSDGEVQHPLPEFLSEQEGAGDDVMAQGGCKYPIGGPYANGQEWHPRLFSHGEYKCVKCKCKDGTVKCERKVCTKKTCHDECCMGHCERHRRSAWQPH